MRDLQILFFVFHVDYKSGATVWMVKMQKMYSLRCPIVSLYWTSSSREPRILNCNRADLFLQCEILFLANATGS